MTHSRLIEVVEQASVGGLPGQGVYAVNGLVNFFPFDRMYLGIRMDDMSKENKQERFSEEQIDEIVVAQAEDDAAWEDPISVRAVSPTTLSLPSELAARATFFAQLHKKTSVEDWLWSIIQERIDFEKAAFAGLKRALAEKGSA